MQKIIEMQDTQTVKNSIKSCHKNYLTLGIDASGMKCLIIGGGRIAARKANTLIAASAHVAILSPEISQSLSLNLQAGQLSWIKSEYRPEYLADYDFIIAATSDAALNIEIGRDARSLGKLYCIVSSAAQSQIIFPAAFENNGLTVAVHSSGTNCRQSKAVRNRLAALMDHSDKYLCRLFMFGFNRAVLSKEDFRKLKEFEKVLVENNSVQNEVLYLPPAADGNAMYKTAMHANCSQMYCCVWRCFSAHRGIISKRACIPNKIILLIIICSIFILGLIRL